MLIRLILVALSLGPLVLPSANAETHRKVKKKTVITTTSESSDDGDLDKLYDDDFSKQDASTPEMEGEDEGEITSTFGSAKVSGMTGCKTEELSLGVIRDLKADCNAWIKDQKSQLGTKYITGSCDEECNDCGMTLRRCAVNGSVRYSKLVKKK